jgi:hypothetical protein
MITRSHWYFLLTGFLLAVALFVFLSFKGCFGTKVKEQMPVFVHDTLTVLLPAKPLTIRAKQIVELWRTDTVKEYVTDSNASEFDTTVTIDRVVTVKQGKVSRQFNDSVDVSINAVFDNVTRQSLFTISPFGYQEIEIPELLPLTEYRSPLFSVDAFGDFDLVNKGVWSVGISAQVDIGTLVAYIAPNANSDHTVSIPVGVKYNLLER